MKFEQLLSLFGSCFILKLLFSHFFFVTDPFADTKEGVSNEKESLIHIRIQQRNGRKTLTTVQGLDQKYDFKKIVKAAKKVSKQKSSERIFSKKKKTMANRTVSFKKLACTLTFFFLVLVLHKT